MLVVAALPDGHAGRASDLVDSTGGVRLKSTHDFWQAVTLCAGGFETRPYINVIVVFQHDNSVNMIGHDYERIQTYMRIVIGQIVPGGGNKSPVLVRTHFPIHHITEQGPAIVGADGYEIRTWLRIVETSQSYGSSMASIWIERHVRALATPWRRRGGFETRPRSCGCCSPLQNGGHGCLGRTSHWAANRHLTHPQRIGGGRSGNRGRAGFKPAPTVAETAAGRIPMHLVLIHPT